MAFWALVALSRSCPSLHRDGESPGPSRQGKAVIVYLASPNTQQQAQAASNMPVLLSYASYSPWLDRYQQSFGRILVDSGAFSELTCTARIDVGAYAAWAERWVGHADAIAGLDDISGDWRRSLENYARVPFSFPTFHDTDPAELLPELVSMARERGGWLGLGLSPPRQGKEDWVRYAVGRIPKDVHIHGWALRAYTHVRQLSSVDSTNWWRDAMRFRRDFPWLTYGECLDIVVKRYVRWKRQIRDKGPLLWNADAGPGGGS